MLGAGPQCLCACCMQVMLLVRRGPVQAACTPKELKELLQTNDVLAHVEPGLVVSKLGVKWLPGVVIFALAGPCSCG